MPPNPDRFPRNPPAMVSVVIPARNAADLLPFQLAALERQDYEGEWEVVVVDNGSTDDTARATASWAHRLPLRVLGARDKPGVSYARNTGIRSARGDLVVFCDADDEVSTAWLRAMVEASRESDAVGGPLDDTKLNHPAIRSWHSTVLAQAPRPASGFLPAVPGGNFAVWIDVLESLGGFSEEYTQGAEDTEFCWRLQLAGYRLGFAQQAIVHIRTRDNLRALSRQFFRNGRGVTQLYRDYRSLGMQAGSIRDALKSSAWLAVHAPDLLRGRTLRGNWVRAAAIRMGKLAGSIENRTVYL